jgi:hypothetical protein
MIGGFIGKPIGGVVGAVAAAIPSVTSWFKPLSDPERIDLTKKGHASAQVASGVIVDPFILTQPELVSIDRWQQPLDQPFPIPRRLDEASQQFSIAPPWAELVTAQAMPGWFVPFSEPSEYLAPRRLETGAQQAFVYTHEWAIPIDRWLQPLSEPRRYAFEKHLPIALYPYLFSEAEFLRANYANVDKVTLHGRHTGTVELSAKHQGTIVLHGIPKGTLPEAI